MKLITLNIWGGHVLEPLLNFFENNTDVDIFCLQEVYHQAEWKISRDDRVVYLDIFEQIQEKLPEHQGYFRPAVNGSYGISIFSSRSNNVIDEGEIWIHNTKDYPGMGPAHSRNLQWLKCDKYNILNVHGLWNGQGKTDSPERIIQAQNIKKFADSLDTPTILCGDLNLRPDTESMKIIEEGLVNLIREHNIHNTRTRYYPKEERYADYILTSPGICVNRFEVLTDEVSDHAPLLIEFK